MKYDEFRALLTGIGPETALGRVVAIRAETDREVIKRFTPEQRRIRNEWNERMAKKVSESDMMAFLETMKKTLIGMAGGIGGGS